MWSAFEYVVPVVILVTFVMTVFALLFVGSFGNYFAEVVQYVPSRATFNTFTDALLTEFQLLTMEKWTEPMQLAELRYLVL